MDDAAHEAATSPNNDLSAPTKGQKDAGNYKKGHVRISGTDVSFENPQGSVRAGMDPETGRRWARRLKSHYGYIRGVPARAPDKDHVDAFVKPGTKNDHTGPVWVIDQLNRAGEFDEPKVMIGFASESEAVEAYLAQYPKDQLDRISGVTKMSPEEFKAKLQDKRAFLRPQPGGMLASRRAHRPGSLTISVRNPTAVGRTEDPLAEDLGIDTGLPDEDKSHPSQSQDQDPAVNEQQKDWRSKIPWPIRNIIPFGPQHSVLPEPIHFQLVTEDEKIVDAIPSISYVHRGLERLVEKRDFVDYVHIADRICGLCSFMHCLGYCQAVEESMAIQVSERALYLTTIWAELSRIHSHIFWLGVAADAFGFESLFMQSLRLRESVLDIIEETTGGRVIFGVCGTTRKPALRVAAR